MIPNRAWASVLVCFIAVELSGCASLPGWMSASSQPIRRSSARKQETRLDIARLHEHQEKLNQAREIYLTILDDDPQNVKAFHRLGVVLTRLGKHDEAIPYYQRAIELNPKNAELLSDFGYALFLTGELETAEEALHQALSIDPSHKRSIGNMAMVQGHLGNFNESLSLFREIVPKAEACANLAYIHVQRGEGQLAIQRYTQALELDETLDSAGEALVQIAMLQNQVERRTPRFNNQPSDESYVASEKATGSISPKIFASRTESLNTETESHTEVDSPTPGQWWSQSADFVLTGTNSHSTVGNETAAEGFPDDGFTDNEGSIDQAVVVESTGGRFSVSERPLDENPTDQFSADELAADEFLPAPHPLVDNSQNEQLQNEQFQDEFEDSSPGVVRLGGIEDDQDDSGPF